MNDEACRLTLALAPTVEVRITVEREPAGLRVAVLHCPTGRARVYSYLADLDAVRAAIETALFALMGEDA